MQRHATTGPRQDDGTTRAVRVQAGPVTVEGDLTIPAGAQRVVLFAHGSGSSRHSSRNRAVARALQQVGLATLLIDLLTAEEEAVDVHTAQFRFDIGLLAERVIGATDWLGKQPDTAALPVGLFGASTGAAAALVAAASRPEVVAAVVSRGGRPDLAGSALFYVQAPTLLIVGSRDDGVIELNRDALSALGAPTKELKLVEGATHLFEEPGALEEVSRLAAAWFKRHLGGERK
jgi:putative phosphoribosyl transferase